jgi:hypothetical protein
MYFFVKSGKTQAAVQRKAKVGYFSDLGRD